MGGGPEGARLRLKPIVRNVVCAGHRHTPHKASHPEWHHPNADKWVDFCGDVLGNVPKSAVAEALS